MPGKVVKLMLQALMLTPVVIQDRLLVKFCVVKGINRSNEALHILDLRKD
jgi:hypothetical protein